MTTNKPSITASTEILAILNTLITRIDNSEKNTKITNTELFSRLDGLASQITSIPAAKPRAASSKSATTSGTPSEKKPPGNSLYWFKMCWKKDPEEMKKNYCTKAMLESLENYMKTDSTAKTKSGLSKLDAEVTYIWKQYVKPKECTALKEKIKKHYEAYIENSKKQSMTPVKADVESGEEDEPEPDPESED